jgi:hypothetical protein
MGHYTFFMAQRTNRRSTSGSNPNANTGASGAGKSRRAIAEELQRIDTARAQREHNRHGVQLELGDMIAAAGSGTDGASSGMLEAELARLERVISGATGQQLPDPSTEKLNGGDVRDGLVYTSELVTRVHTLLREARLQRQVWVREAVRMRIPAIEVAQLCGVERNTAQVWQREIRAGRRKH